MVKPLLQSQSPSNFLSLDHLSFVFSSFDIRRPLFPLELDELSRFQVKFSIETAICGVERQKIRKRIRDFTCEGEKGTSVVA